MLPLILSLLTVSCLSHAQIISNGTCNPNVTVQQDFDIPRYAGVWFEIWRYESFFQLNGECVTATYTPQNETVGVLNRMVRNNTEVLATGFVVPDPLANGTGKLLVSIDNNTSPYWVLKTDYDDYVLVYSCVNLPLNNKAITSWVMSRTRTLSPMAVLAVNDLIEETEGLDWTRYRQTNHAESICRVNDEEIF